MAIGSNIKKTVCKAVQRVVREIIRSLTCPRSYPPQKALAMGSFKARPKLQELVAIKWEEILLCQRGARVGQPIVKALGGLESNNITVFSPEFCSPEFCGGLN